MDIKKRLRLDEDHPTFVKFNKLCDLADELGIKLCFQNNNLILIDQNSDLPSIDIEDIEPNHWFDSFPPTTEFVLTYTNPEYTRLNELAILAYKAEIEAKELALREQARIAKEQEELRRLKEVEDSERNMLSFLKQKYES